jgi:Fic family protein
MQFSLKILPIDLIDEYQSIVDESQLNQSFSKLEEAPLSTSRFSFYTSVASVYSSKIEGEEIELDSFIKHKRDGISFQPDYTKKTDDLYDAYEFAQKNELNRENIVAVHKIITRHILSEDRQGKLRKGIMYVATPDGKMEYVAANPASVKTELDVLYEDIESLVSKKLNISEAIFFASLIHLVFVKIHPWDDGNGRTARLLEKWFLANSLGEKAWFIQSEKYYYENHQEYYKNLRRLGLEYEELDYKVALPFLLMLAKAAPKPPKGGFR